MTANTEPQMRILSLGAGVQSTTLLLLSANGELPKLDAAIFSDTGWEPRAVYEHLDKIEEQIANPAGIPIYRVNNGNLRNDVLNPNKMRSVPAYTAGPPREVEVVDEWRLCPCDWAEWHVKWDLILLGEGDDKATAETRDQATSEKPPTCPTCGEQGRIAVRSHTEIKRDLGMLNRKCTQQYKLRPILEQVRLLLGSAVGEERPCKHCDGTGQRVAPWRAKRGENVVADCSVCEGLGTISRVGQPPAGKWAEQWIGFSTDEITRVSSRGDTRYSKSRYPLLELNMSRTQCETYLKHHGWTSVAKSACIGCPFHGNAEWRRMRDTDPESWANAVAFDKEYRHGAGMKHERFLHISCQPLDAAPINRVRPSETQQDDLFDAAFEQRLEDGDPDGCSPWACRSGEAVTA
jgi:hypothetical protein